MFPVYEFIADYIGKKLGIDTELVTCSSFDQFERGEVDAGYICGLPYVELTRRRPAPVELLAAPVLEGDRYKGRPIYFSDVIVRRDRPFGSFADLRGRTWSYNDPDSQSGYGITRYWLARMGETGGFFGRVVEAGFHQRSVQMVAAGEIDASAIDSQVLAIELRDRPELAEQVKVIDALGPSTIQPVVAASRLPEGLKADLRAVFLEIGQDPGARRALEQGLIRRFAAVDDSTYDDIREMIRVCEAAGFMEIR
jgi:phosphonate transport system substrate-binding protein